MAKRITRGSGTALTFAILIAAVAVAGWLAAGPGDRPAEANHDLILGVDVLPLSSPANTATSLGSLEACGVISGPPGTIFEVDIYVSGGVDKLQSWETYVRYDSSVLKVLGPGDGNQNNNDKFLFQQQSPFGLGFQNLSDTLPDGDARYRILGTDTALTPQDGAPSGVGVLVRMQFQTRVSSGSSQILIDKFDSEVGPLGPWLKDVDGNQINNTDGDVSGLLDSAVVNGTVVVGSGTCSDTDGDNVQDIDDNCPFIANGAQQSNIPGVGNQTDTDGDGLGDACDDDDDSDGLLDGSDPAPQDPDLDGDNVSDGPNDPDGAGPIVAGPDNCISDANPGQENTDVTVNPPGDALGDACDPDDDNDTVLDGADNCQFVPNGPNEAGDPGVGNQTDTDGDGIGDACDPDADGDGFAKAEEDWVSADWLDDCGAQTLTSPYYSQAWPADVFSAGLSVDKVDLQDIGSFLAPIPRFNTSPGDAGYHIRWDIVPGAGIWPNDINLQDLGRLITLSPPMFNNQTAFNHAPCTP